MKKLLLLSAVQKTQKGEWIMKGKVLVMIGVMVAAAVGVTWAWAQDSAEVYYACVNNSSGTIHMVGPDDACSVNEILIEWNQVGPAGADGSAGLSCWDLNSDQIPGAEEDVNGDGSVDVLDCAGPQGPPGADGAPGPQGEPGTLALAGQSCPEGEFVMGFDIFGDIICPSTGADCDDFSPGANLYRCDLAYAYLYSVNLENAMLALANLEYADLEGANLRGANLTSASLRHAFLPQADLSGAILTDADLPLADLTEAFLVGADLTDASLWGTVLNSADLSSAVLTSAWMEAAYLVGADLTGADLYGAYLAGAQFTGADLTGANLGGTMLEFVDLTGAILIGADLTSADLLELVFWGNTLCPDGTNSDDNTPPTCEGHLDF